jgi:hypothetical protein
LSLRQVHNLTRLSRNALVTTDTELSAMAAPAATATKPKAGVEHAVGNLVELLPTYSCVYSTGELPGLPHRP